MILAIMAALGVTGISGYVANAKQTARESVARSIFLAGQTALTHAYNQDAKYYENNRSPIMPDGTGYLTATEAAKQAHNPPALVYLKIDGGADNSDTALYKMLSPYINDKSILNNAILIEFNRETGKMLSAFYSDEAGVTLGYGTGASYDVRKRTETDLTEGLVGYYGVQDTGEVVRTDPIEGKITLVDHVSPQEIGYYGLLTAEIELPLLENLPDSAVCELILVSTGGGQETLRFAKGNVEGVDFQLSALDLIQSADAAIANPRAIVRNGETRKIPVFCERAGNKQKLVVILDGVRSLGEESLGITTNFPQLLSGFLYGTLITDPGGNATSYYSEDASDRLVHVLYGHDSDLEGDGLTVESVRHLNNLRYCRDDSRFTQTQNIYLWNHNGEALRFTPIGNRLDGWENSEGKTVYGFGGTYVSSASYAIYDLFVDLTEQANIPGTTSERDDEGTALLDAGLFDTIRSGGRVENLRFASSNAVTGSVPKRLLVASYADENKAATGAVAQVMGIRSAGGVAARNAGTILNCTMLGYVSAKYADGINDGRAGGIAGENAGSITKCASACAVTGAKYAGGIAGMNTGSIAQCEAGTASWRSANDPKNLYLSGTAAYGAADGANGTYASGTHTANNTFRIQISENDGCAGGIAGCVNGGSVIACVNACKVEAGNESADGEPAEQLTGGIAGGIAGEVDTAGGTAIGYCYNAGAIYATGSAGGLVGHVEQGAIAYGYNTGYINREYAVRTYDADGDYFLPGITRNLTGGVNSSGGLIGTGTDATNIQNCYSAQYAGDVFGGAFGVLAKEAVVRNCSFLWNVLNTTTNYYVSTDKHIDDFAATHANNLRLYSVKNLVNAPADDNLDKAYFRNGSLTARAGVFQYPYPTIMAASGLSTLPTHRTPWNPTIMEYGAIGLDGTMQKGAMITATFYLAPPEGYIYLRNGNNLDNSANLIYCIPLNDARGYNSLTDARVAPNTWHFIYGYACAYKDVASRERSDATFEIMATKLDTQNDAELVAMGYTYRYQIRMTYGPATVDERLGRIDSNRYSHIIAELYNLYKGTDDSTRYVANAHIGNCQITLHDPTQGSTSSKSALVMRLSGVTLDDADELCLTLIYKDGASTTQTITIGGNALNHAPGSYLDALADSAHHRAEIAPSGHYAPYYVERDGNKKIYNIVLWTNDEAQPDAYQKPNGLLTDATDFPVLIKAERRTATAAPITIGTKNLPKDWATPQ